MQHASFSGDSCNCNHGSTSIDAPHLLKLQKLHVYSALTSLGPSLADYVRDYHCLIYRTQQAVRDADRKLNLRRRFKHAAEDAKRLAPYWKRNFQQFAASPLGKVVLWGFFIWSVLSGLLFRVRCRCYAPVAYSLAMCLPTCHMRH
jgi:hypothetical protein